MRNLLKSKNTGKAQKKNTKKNNCKKRKICQKWKTQKKKKRCVCDPPCWGSGLLTGQTQEHQGHKSTRNYLPIHMPNCHFWRFFLVFFWNKITRNHIINPISFHLWQDTGPPGVYSVVLFQWQVKWLACGPHGVLKAKACRQLTKTMIVWWKHRWSIIAFFFWHWRPPKPAKRSEPGFLLASMQLNKIPSFRPLC